MLNIYYFLLFLTGVGQLYIIYGVKDYYKKIKHSIIKRIIGKEDNSKLNEVTRESMVIGYFNLFTSLIILIGVLTDIWWYFLAMFIVIQILNTLQTKIELTPDKLDTTLFVSKAITYTIIGIKVIGLLYISLNYYHG
jgi:heme/copper-type cytochrome/quinol oxidase subunit 4